MTRLGFKIQSLGLGLVGLDFGLDSGLYSPDLRFKQTVFYLCKRASDQRFLITFVHRVCRQALLPHSDLHSCCGHCCRLTYTPTWSRRSSVSAVHPKNFGVDSTLYWGTKISFLSAFGGSDDVFGRYIFFYIYIYIYLGAVSHIWKFFWSSRGTHVAPDFIYTYSNLWNC